MKKIKVAFFDSKEYDKKSFNEYNKSYGYKITYFENKLNEETAILAKGYDAVCVFVHDVIDKKTIKKLEEYGVKVIALRCAGYNNVDMNGVNSIKVVRVPDYSPHGVAEHSVALLLGLNRKIYKAYQRTKKYNFSLDGLLGFDLYGKTVGVLGTGKIGSAFIGIMKGFGCNVLAYDIYQNKELEKSLGFKYVSLEELLKSSKIVSLHCPLTKETEKVINKKTLGLMQNGAYIINTSRGQLIETKDLIAQLETGKIAGLGLDVYEDEAEYFFNDMSNVYKRDKQLSYLLSMPNVLVTSHQGFFTEEALSKIAKDTMGNIKEIMQGKVCINEVKK